MSKVNTVDVTLSPGFIRPARTTNDKLKGMINIFLLTQVYNLFIAVICLATVCCYYLSGGWQQDTYLPE
jgi:hypothetical protein